MPQIITPNTRGHYPRGYPRSGNGSSVTLVEGENGQKLETATDSPDLTIFKTALDEAQSDAAAYFTRNSYARDWWYARWPGQTVDGRAWSGDDSTQRWLGCSDTRVRTVEKVIGQHRTLATFALRNMKIQAKSNRPFSPISDTGNRISESGMGAMGAGSDLSGIRNPKSEMPSSSQGKESQQATTLLNWMLFTHMTAELHRELRLAVSWRNGYGAAVLHAGWFQMRQLNQIDVSVPALEEFVNAPEVRQFMGSQSAIPLGENLSIMDLQEMIMDPAYADDLADLLRAMSHDYLTVREARKKLDDLRQLRTVQIPIPSVFVSRPQITALRPMVDIIFPAHAGDLQRNLFSARIEMVSETELRDRIITAHYDADFVDDVLEHRGPSSEWQMHTARERSGIGGSPMNSTYADSIELIHFYSLVSDRGVPVRFHTVFHRNLDTWAIHEPAGYDHGESCDHPLRFEIEESRAILDSQGIAEKAYSWEQELKRQYDAWVDRTDISMNPPLVTSYDQVAKIKEAYQPKAIIPMRKFDEAQFMKVPPFDQVSVLIVQNVEARIREHFGIFGNDLDPALKKLRQEEFVDDTLAELKPVFQQTLKLCRQFLPDDQVASVVGTLSRPFRLDPETLRNEFEISATVDLRDIDTDWAKERFGFAAQLFGIDTQGQMNRTPILKSLANTLGYDLAESALPDDQQVVTQAEVENEQQKIDLIIGSGQDQPLPKGANFQLRLQTLQAKVQAIQQNPATSNIIRANPDIMKVIENRQAYFERQLQQQQNAQIGRMQVSQTFSKSAPTIAAPMGAAY